MTATNKNGAGPVVGKGEYYKAKDGDEIVVVFYTDLHQIAYAPLRSSKETRETQEEFLDKYERTDVPMFDEPNAPATVASDEEAKPAAKK